MKKLLYLYTCICFISSCQSSDRSKTNNDNLGFDFKLSDSIKRDVSSSLYDTNSQIHFSQTLKSLGLERLDNGYDQKQIRIWTGYNLMDTQYLIILKEHDFKWSAEFHSYKFNFKKDNLRSEPEDEEWVFSTKNHFIQVDTPKCGWPLFIDSLQAFRIDTLLDADKIPGYSFPAAEGGGISVEFASRNFFHTYGYSLLRRDKDLYNDPKKLYQALLFVKRQFNVHFNYP